MSMYCENCYRLVESDPCPHCGSAVREAEPRDSCFLTEQGYVQATILADILTQNSIPYMTKMRSIKGCGPIMMGNRLFYVPYQLLNDAQNVVEELFYTHEEESGNDQPVEGMLKDDGSEAFTPDEIDELPDTFVPEKMNLEELTIFKKKLAATVKALKIQERVNRERMDLLRDLIDETDFAIEDIS